MFADILSAVPQYSFYTGCVIFIGGIIGNALNILIFTNLKSFRVNRSALYLTVESIANFVYQFISIVVTVLTAIYGDDATGRSLVWCRLRYIWAQMCVLISFSMICCAACDQFFSTNYRFNLRQMCTLKLARYLTFIVPCMSLIHSILFGFSFNIQPSFGCVISNPMWSRYASFFLYPVLLGLLPIVIASLFSLLAFYNVRHIIRLQVPIARRQLDRQMTAMVLIRVVFFVILTLPYAIYRIYVTNFPLSRADLLQYAIGRLFQAISLSFASMDYTVRSSYLIHIVNTDLF
jgi:hypothetical protein